MEARSKKAGYFALSLLAIAVNQAVYADEAALPEVSVTSTTIDDASIPSAASQATSTTSAEKKLITSMAKIL